MLRRFLNFFRDPEDTNPSFIRLVRNILIFTLVTNIGIIVLVTGVIPGTFQNIPAAITLSIITALVIVSFVLTQRGKVGMAKFFVPIALLIAITYIAISGGGLHDVSILAYPIVIIISTLLLGKKSRLIVTPLAIAAIEIVVLADLAGVNKSQFRSATSLDDAFIVGLLLLANSGILQLLIGRLSENVLRARENEQAQLNANRELRELQVTLEDRVASRTAEIELANQRNEKRARQFKAIAQVARATASDQDLETLLPNLVDVISRQFSFYHAGIFLLDENREFAELRAANSEGGRRMLARGHKLGVGHSGIVGFVSATGKPRIALDVGDDAAFFNNPDLPSTRSEMALPLRVADEIIGVLDVQSTTSNAFQEEDLEVLSTLADQVAIAIQNARSYETTQQLLKEAQLASGSFIGDAWRIMQAQEATPIGYRVAENKLTLLDRPLSSALINEAISGKKVAKENGQKATLAIPIRLREEVIGVMDIQVPHAHEWETDEVDIVQAVAERLSLALESALLLKSTQRRADIERITADISGKIGATTQFDSILRTAAEELSRALGGSEVLVQIQPLESDASMSD
jgi:GAF domain-containing protein